MKKTPNQNQPPHTFSKKEEKPWKLNVQNIHCCFGIHQGFKHFSSHIMIFAFSRSILHIKRIQFLYGNLNKEEWALSMKKGHSIQPSFSWQQEEVKEHPVYLQLQHRTDIFIYSSLSNPLPQIIQCRWIVSIK